MSTHEEQPTTNRPTLDDDEAILLAHFDRYIDSDAPLNPVPPPPEQHSQPHPMPPQDAPTGKPSEPEPEPEPEHKPKHEHEPEPSPALEILTASYPQYDPQALSAILASVDNDFNAAEALLVAQHPSSTQSDAELARRLQLREQRREHRREHRREQRRHRRNDAPIPLDKPVMDRAIATLREIVVPSLRAHFAELVLPDYRDDSASLVYSLNQLQVTALTLPSDNVAVTPAANMQAIHVNVLNSHLELEVGHWSYENRGFVPVKDAGRASVSVHGLNIAMRLEPRWSHAGDTRLVILECNVTVDGVVRFRTQGAAADWAYNAIAVVLKPIVVSYLKETVADAVTQALAVHLRQWAFAGSLDAVDSRNSPATNTSSEPVTAAE